MKKVVPAWLIFVFILVFFLRLPSLFDPYSYGDEGVYLTLGEAVRRGLVLYRDIYDNKPPFIYLLTALAGNLFWFRFFLLVANLATIYFFYKLSGVLLNSKNKAVKIATTIFALLSSLPVIEGNIANAEIFMILPIIVGVLLIARTGKLTPKVLFVTGVLFSLATLLKVPAAFDPAAIVCYVVFFRKNKLWLLIVQRLQFLILGFALPLLITIVYFLIQGALGHYISAAFSQNIPYLSSWQGKSHSIFSLANVSSRAILLFFALLSLWYLRKRIPGNLLLIFLWFLFSVFAATLSGRPYPHYLIQVLPSLSLLIAAVTFKGTKTKLIIILFLVIFAATFFYFKFWHYSIIPYYRNFLLFVLKREGQEEYFRGFDSKVPQTYQLAQFLTTHTESKERVFIWGDSPVVYALSHRLPVGRYVASYHIIDFDGYQETIQALKREKPRFIIDLHDEERPFPQLNLLIAQDYRFFAQIGKAEIFHLIPTSF